MIFPFIILERDAAIEELRVVEVADKTYGQTGRQAAGNQESLLGDAGMRTEAGTLLKYNR